MAVAPVVRVPVPLCEVFSVVLPLIFKIILKMLLHGPLDKDSV